MPIREATLEEIIHELEQRRKDDNRIVRRTEWTPPENPFVAAETVPEYKHTIVIKLD